MSRSTVKGNIQTNRMNVCNPLMLSDISQEYPDLVMAEPGVRAGQSWHRGPGHHQPIVSPARPGQCLPSEATEYTACPGSSDQ